MRFRVLGPLTVTSSTGADVTPRGRRSLDLTAVLVQRRREAVTPQTLLDLVWPDQAAELGPAVVHTSVARLRRGWGAGVIESTPLGYRLSPTVSVDEDAFADLVQLARDQTEPRAALAAYDDAVGLWEKGTPYGGVSDDVVAADRHRLSQQRDDARQALAAALLATGSPADAERAIGEARALLVDDPLREAAHELVIAACAQLGRQAEALAAFETLRRTLREDLGIDPGPAAAALHARVLAQDPTLLQPGVPPGAARRSLPRAPLTALVGRDDELAALTEAVEERRLVTLTGPGGVGKTRLLVELLHARAADGDPVGLDLAYLDLGCLEIADPDDLTDAVARAVGAGPRRDAGLGDLAAAIGQRRALLAIDEAERHLEACREVLSSLLRDCPGLRIVVASREPLDLTGEQQIVLRPLAVPDAGATAEAIHRAPAVRLLVARLRDRVGPWVDDETQAGQLGTLARRVDGLPLALELLARSAGAAPLSDLAEAARDPLSLTGEADRPGRHRSLRDVVGDSLATLPADHREVLESLGVFAGGFGVAAARAVTGRADVRPTLHELARRSLVDVVRDDRGLHLRLLAPVRDLARDELRARGELLEARARHRRWYAARWRDAPRSDALLLDVRDHYADYVLALRTALDDGDATVLADLAIALARVWAFADQHAPARRWLGRVLDSGLLGEVGEARVRTMRAIVMLYRDAGAARDDLAAAAPVLEAADDTGWLVSVHTNRALQRLDRGDVHGALEAAELAAELAGRCCDGRLPDALSLLAVTRSLTDPEAAPGTIEHAWLLACAAGSTATLESVANNLFLAQMQLGRPEAARLLLADAQARCQAHPPPPFLVIDQAWSLLYDDRPAEAAQVFGSLVAGEGDDASDTFAAEIYAGLGRALLAAGHPSGATLVAGAGELLRRAGSVLLPWQLPAEVLAALPESPTVETTSALGGRLAAVARAAVRALERSGGVTGSAHGHAGVG